LFLAYSLFVSLVCKELQDGLEGTQPFVVMDTVHTIVRILTKPEGKEREGMLRELFAPCCDILLTLCKATLEACPKVLLSLCQRNSNISEVDFALLAHYFFTLGVRETPAYYCHYTGPICTAADN